MREDDTAESRVVCDGSQVWYFSYETSFDARQEWHFESEEHLDFFVEDWMREFVTMNFEDEEQQEDHDKYMAMIEDNDVYGVVDALNADEGFSCFDYGFFNLARYRPRNLSIMKEMVRGTDDG